MAGEQRDVLGQLLDERALTEAAPEHLDLDGDLVLFDEQVGSRADRRRAGGAFLVAHVVEVDEEERPEQVLHVVLVCDLQGAPAVMAAAQAESDLVEPADDLGHHGLGLVRIGRRWAAAGRRLRLDVAVEEVAAQRLEQGAGTGQDVSVSIGGREALGLPDERVRLIGDKPPHEDVDVGHEAPDVHLVAFLHIIGARRLIDAAKSVHVSLLMVDRPVAAASFEHRYARQQGVDLRKRIIALHAGMFARIHRLQGCPLPAAWNCVIGPIRSGHGPPPCTESHIWHPPAPGKKFCNPHHPWSVASGSGLGS